MTSLPIPSSNYLASTPSGKRAHRHRRSAAISGDFSTMELGLFSPPHPSSTRSLSSQHSPRPSLEADDNFELDKHFHFNNEEDFIAGSNTNSDGFSFPTKSPEVPERANVFTRHMNSMSPVKRGNFHASNSMSLSLNSPIRLGSNSHRRTASSSNANLSKGRCSLNTESQNIPEAVIDLDEILHANLHIGGSEFGYSSPNNSNSNLNHKRTESVPANYTYDDDFLASPFIKQSASSFHSPLNSYNSSSMLNSGNFTTSIPLFNQPIQESTADSIIEEDNDEFEFEEIKNGPTSEFMGSDTESGNDIFANPPPAMSNVFSNMSANSSTSSLRSGGKSHLIEKTYSNSSKESANSLPGISLGTIGTIMATKNSGAKANRYQSFYDQSNRISNAMKETSSDSINIVRSNSSGNCLTLNTPPPPSKELRLGHSSSLPILKSSVKRATSQIDNHSRLIEKRMFSPEYKRAVSPPIRTHEKFQSASSPSLSISKNEAPSALRSCISSNVLDSKEDTVLSTSSKTASNLDDIKNSSTSPISMKSLVSSTVISSSGTLQSTDDSSMLSQNNVPISDDKSRTATVPNAYDDSSLEMSIQERLQNTTPSIVVSTECEEISSPSTNSTVQQDDFNSDKIIRPNENTILADCTNATVRQKHKSSFQSAASTISSSETSPKRSSPRRPVSSSEERILHLTQMPAYSGNKPLVSSQLLSTSASNSQIITTTTTTKINVTSNPQSPIGAVPIISSDIDVDVTPKQEISDYSKRSSIYSFPKDLASNRLGRHSSIESAALELPASVSRRRHAKAKSMSFSLMDSSTRFVDKEDSDSSTIMKAKRKERLLNWFKKR
ncbi:uncharacterized protein RJT20DRAFT_135098 [Scheffersomyces xylosifermentans]|uniref:uncharacterized protein n=1 Tax=Scheffersomyces xylosifermentans TaxID=1304137 RepID=UPI00315C5A9B